MLLFHPNHTVPVGHWHHERFRHSVCHLAQVSDMLATSDRPTADQEQIIDPRFPTLPRKTMPDIMEIRHDSKVSRASQIWSQKMYSVSFRACLIHSHPEIHLFLLPFLFCNRYFPLCNILWCLFLLPLTAEWHLAFKPCLYSSNMTDSPPQLPSRSATNVWPSCSALYYSATCVRARRHQTRAPDMMHGLCLIIEMLNKYLQMADPSSAVQGPSIVINEASSRAQETAVTVPVRRLDIFSHLKHVVV